MSRLAATLLLLAALAVCSADAAAPARIVTLAGVPETLVAGQAWTAKLTVRPAATPTLVATAEARRLTVRARRTGPGRYAATVRFPLPGAWRLTVLAGRQSFALGHIRVIPSYPLALPAQILGVDDRSLLVVERLGRGRILRVDARTGRFAVVTTRIPSPWGLTQDANGRVLVSGGNGIYELGGRKLAAVPASPIAAATNGDIYFADESRVGRIGRDGRLETLTTDVVAPHGLVLRRDGSLVVAHSGNGRVLRIDPATRTTTVVTSGFATRWG